MELNEGVQDVQVELVVFPQVISNGGFGQLFPVFQELKNG